MVKKLFTDKKIDILIGYEQGSLPCRSRPCIIRSADDADRLVWNSFCTNNLAVYLPQFFPVVKPKRGEEPPPPPNVGVVAKGCDARSVIGLVREHQIPREHVLIIGLPCEGMIDPAKVDAACGGDVVAEGAVDGKGGLTVTTRSGKQKKLAKDKVTMDACLECPHPAPEGADVLVEGTPRKAAGARYSAAKEFEKKPADKKWQYFIDEISKCIRCYACRQACPNCFCKECFADQTNPRWIGVSNDLSDILLYHIGRVFHQAGRCVECDACVRACPMGIDLRTFTQKMASDVKELYDYVPGFSAEELPPLCTFTADDRQDFITEP